jgi:hypothetical protein
MYFGLHGKLPIPVTAPYKCNIVDATDLQEACGSVVVKALCNNLEGRVFNTRRGDF